MCCFRVAKRVSPILALYVLLINNTSLSIVFPSWDFVLPQLVFSQSAKSHLRVLNKRNPIGNTLQALCLNTKPWLAWNLVIDRSEEAVVMSLDRFYPEQGRIIQIFQKCQKKSKDFQISKSFKHFKKLLMNFTKFSKLVVREVESCNCLLMEEEEVMTKYNLTSAAGKNSQFN